MRACVVGRRGRGEGPWSSVDSKPLQTRPSLRSRGRGTGWLQGCGPARLCRRHAGAASSQASQRRHASGQFARPSASRAGPAQPPRADAPVVGPGRRGTAPIGTAPIGTAPLRRGRLRRHNRRMRRPTILADENIPFARDAFGTLGEVRLTHGRRIAHADLADVDLLVVRSITKEMLRWWPARACSLSARRRQDPITWTRRTSSGSASRSTRPLAATPTPSRNTWPPRGCALRSSAAKPSRAGAWA